MMMIMIEFINEKECDYIASLLESEKYQYKRENNILRFEARCFSCNCLRYEVAIQNELLFLDREDISSIITYIKD